ncbi:MAG: metalloregulator ArsR/SmtB family transcription factor [Candidatus Bathyarchaeia archaeon]
MSRLKIDERLVRLISSGLCPQEDASKYAAELRQLADTVARADLAEKRSRFFKALADPTRLRILKLLEVREMCVCEIMIALGLTQPTTSHHLGIMENVGLIKGRKEGKWVYYSIADLELIKNIEKLNLI